MLYDYFDVYPRILPVGQCKRVTIKPRYEQRSFAVMQKDGRIWVEYAGDNGTMFDGRATKWGEFEPLPVQAYDEATDCWTMDVTLPHEGEYTLRLVIEPADGRPKREIFHFAMYALEEDLFGLRPFRGDMHCHTSYSECGNRDENPRYVAAYACYAGLDYLAITDHMQRDPSVLAQKYLEPFELDFQIFNGEEIHLLPKPVDTLVCRNRFEPAIHLVNFGGKQSVAKYMNDHFDEFNAQLNANAEKLDPKQPQKTRWLMAGADWVFDKIHEYGGVAIFAHPFWHAVMRENLPQPVREYIMKERKFDAIELIGLSANMQSREDNMVNVNWWMQENMKSGKMIPVVGNTDSHGARGSLNRRATIVFAKDKSFESIAEGICSGHSVAGSFYDGEGPVLYGDYRLVDFAYFLCREFYPEHDEESKLLGSVLMDNLRGGCDDATVKAVGKNRLTKLFKKYWA